MTTLVCEIKRLRLTASFDWSTSDGYVSITQLEESLDFSNPQPFVWISLWDFSELISSYLQAQRDPGWRGWCSADTSITPLDIGDATFELDDANNDVLLLSLSELNDLTSIYFIVSYLTLILQRSPDQHLYFYNVLDAKTTFSFRTETLFITFSAAEGFTMFDLRGCRKLKLTAKDALELELFAQSRPASTEAMLRLAGCTLSVSSYSMLINDPNAFNFEPEDWRYLATMFYDLSACGSIDVSLEYAGCATLQSTWITLSRGEAALRESVTMKLATFSRLALLATPGRSDELQKGTNPCLAFFVIDEGDGVCIEPLFDEKGCFKNAIGLRSAELLEKQPKALSITLDELQELAGFNLICLQLVHLLSTQGLIKPERNVLNRVRLLPTSRLHFAIEAYDIRFTPTGNLFLSGMSIGDWKPSQTSGTKEAGEMILDRGQCFKLLEMTVEEILPGLERDGFVQAIDDTTKLGIWPSTEDFPKPEPGLVAISEKDWYFICDCMRLYLAMQAFFE